MEVSISTISQNRQISLPAAACRALDVKPKDKVLVVQDGSSLRILPLAPLAQLISDFRPLLAGKVKGLSCDSEIVQAVREVRLSVDS